MVNVLKQLRYILLCIFMFCSLSTYAASVNQLFHQSNDPVLGDKNGKITIVEFFDYQCSHCVDMGPVLSSIEKTNPNVRIVLKEFPIRGSASEFAARAALAANLQGKYQIFHNALLQSTQPLSEQSILQIAKTSGLDMVKLKKDMGSSSISNHIRSIRDLAVNLKLAGTPAFYIGKTDAQSMSDVKFYLGEITKVELQSIIHSFN